MRQSLDLGSSDNPTTSMSITIDNKKIGNLELKMQTVFKTWEELILRKERDRVRKENGEVALDEDEGDEEQFEVKKCIEELRNKDLFERDIDVPSWIKENEERTSLKSKKFFEERDQIIHSLHLDVLMNLYRCEIKLGKEMTIIKRQTNDMLTSQGIDLQKKDGMTALMEASIQGHREVVEVLVGKGAISEHTCQGSAARASGFSRRREQ